MGKFQVGDTVRRIGDTVHRLDGTCRPTTVRVKQGGEYVVRSVSTLGNWIGLHLEPEYSGDGNDYLAKGFELVSRAEGLLSINEVVQCILDDVALEFRVKGSTEWRTAYVVDSFTIRTIKSYEFRKLKPRKPVVINGVVVPPPMNTPYTGAGWGVNMTYMAVYPLTVRDDATALVWKTKEDALQVLNTMLALFEDK